MKKALFPGSFDPITTGHVDMLNRALPLFDHIVIGIGVNSRKKNLFSLEERKAMIRAAFPDNEKVSIESFEGLTINYAESQGIQFMLRGLRNNMDLEYEKTISRTNKHLKPHLDTVFLLPSGSTSHISSTLVRELIHHKAPLDGLVPPEIIPMIYKDNA